MFIKCIYKYVNVCLGRGVGAAEGLWLTLLSACVNKRCQASHVRLYVSTNHLSYTQTHAYAHMYTHLTSTRSMLVGSYVSTHIIQLSALHYGCPYVTEKHAEYIYPSLVSDMSLCLYHGSMDTGV